MRRSRTFSAESRQMIDSFLRQYSIDREVEIPGKAAALAAMDCVEWGQIEALVAKLNQSESAGWSTRFAESIGVAAHGPLGFAALSAENLYAGLDLFRNYLLTRLNFFSIETRAEKDLLTIILRPQIESSVTLSVMQELLCASVVLLIDTMHDIDIEKLSIFSEKNEGLQNLCDRWGISHQTRSPLSISFPVSWLELPSFYADATAFETNLIRCQQQKQLLQQLATPFTARVDQHLESFFNKLAIDFKESGQIHAAPTIDCLAGDFHTSSRTLIRRLKQEGSSYKGLLRTHRESLAKNYLLSKDSVETVAHLLGYSDASNFIRAFQDWTGLTPAVWREGNTGS